MIFIRTLLICLVLSLLISRDLHAQKIILPLSPLLKAKDPSYFTDSSHRNKYLLQVGEDHLFQQLPASLVLLRRYNDILLVTCTPWDFIKHLASVKGLLYADENISPTVDGGILNYDMSLNRINAVWQQFPLLTGAGRSVSVKEDRMDSTDIDLLGRSIPSSVASSRGSTHATAMTTLIAGAGNSFYTGRGVAPKALYSSSDFSIVLPDTATYYLQSDIMVQNHSYGVGIQNYYGINARAFDLSQNMNSSLQHIFSAGNSGTSTSSFGTYAGIPGYANITGNMKMAKNVLVAGAVDSTGKTPPLSSRGPAYDGRIKPEIAAYGDDGSSGAAAIVSGTCILLQQAFLQYYRVNPASWLLRSIVINSADDAGTPGPDFESGYGVLNAAASVKTVRDNRFFTGVAVQGSENDFFIDIPPSSHNLKCSLSWNDTAAQTGAAKALVNDIDMVLIHESTGTVWLPWVLNTFPSADSLRKPAARGVDTLNNNEQVSVDDPLPGRYIIRVKGRVIAAGQQPFALSYRWDTDSSFQWNFPLRDDPVVSGSRIFARWNAVYPKGTRGELQWTFNAGATWSRISDTILLEKQLYEVRIPDTLSAAKFRMIIGGGNIESDEFFISPSMSTRFGFSCDTNLLVYWNKIPAATGYRIYQLSDNAMSAKKSTADTSTILSGKGSPYFSVSPLSGGREGFRGPALNYLQQGVGCYINSFLADLVNVNNAKLQLGIGSVYKVKRITIKKISRNNEILFSTDQPAVAVYTFTDLVLEQGLNQYQALLTLDNGTVISSAIETVYYLNSNSHIIFPNPVQKGGRFYLLSDFPVEGNGVIYDAWGRVMMHFAISDKQQEIPVNRLNGGVYYMIIFQQGKLLRRLPFIVQ